MITRILKFLRIKKDKGAVKKLRPEDAAAEAVVAPELPATGEEPGPRRRRKRKRKPKQAGAEAGAAAPQVVPDDDWEIGQFEVVEAAGKTRFHDLDLPAPVMHAIADLGFQYCTPIQAEALPKTLAGHDVIGQAQTGTGKTAAFLITLLSRFFNNPAGDNQPVATPRTLVLAPTRELVMQIAKEAEELARYCPFQVVGVYGGIDYQKQLNQIASRPVDIMVATPGRLLDFQRQGAVDLSKVEILVIDEADRMLDMGFIPDVRRIVQSTPAKEQRQTLFFSATMTPEVNHLAAQWTRKAEHIVIEPQQVAGDSVEQIVYLTTAHEKYNLLYNVITRNDLKRVIIFTNRRDETRRLADRLKSNDISCAMLSGEVPQHKRIKTLEDFRAGKIRVLVATDVAGRGIHIDDVSHVINYTLPFDAEDYVHRIGRTGRAGASGISISFACEEGSFYIPDIEKFLDRKLECIYPPAELLAPAPKGTRPVESASQGGGRPKSSSGRPPQRRRSSRPRR